MRGNNVILKPEDFSMQVTGIEKLIAILSNKDGLKRQNARVLLVKIGRPAIPYLESLLNLKEYRTRWEAIKAISSVPHPDTIPALLKCLDDENEDIRWVAAEGMIELEKQAVKPLLKSILINYESINFCETAHHILKELVVRKSFTDTTNIIPMLIEKDKEDSQIPLSANAKLAELSNKLKS
jgi:HEAT repeat protein